MPFGDQLKRLLEARDMTVAELSRRTGINQSTLYSYLRRNTQKIDPAALKVLAEALGVDVYQFLGAEAAAPTEEDELWEVRESFRRNPELRTLFSLSKDATAGELRQMEAFIRAIRATGEYDGDDPA